MTSQWTTIAAEKKESDTHPQSGLFLQNFSFSEAGDTA